jgi:DinB family
MNSSSRPHHLGWKSGDGSGHFERPESLAPWERLADNLVHFAIIGRPSEVDRVTVFSDEEGRRCRTPWPIVSANGSNTGKTLTPGFTQLFGHSSYHRGQIATLVRTAGGEPAATDYIYWCREPAPEG